MERGKELYEEGTLSKADLSQLQAQASSDRYNLVSTETTLQDYRLQLKQMLELDGDVLMELAMPEIPDEAVLSIIPDKASVYASALESRPEVLSGKLDVDAAELNIAISKAGILTEITGGLSEGDMVITEARMNEETKKMMSREAFILIKYYIL